MARTNSVANAIPTNGLTQLRARLDVRALPRHPALVLGALCVALLVTLIVAMRIGTVSIEPAQIIAILSKRMLGLDLGRLWSGAEESIIWQIRLPRVLGAALVGGGLATAGVVFQGLLRNPMADPYLLGTSSGAALAATIAFAIPFAFGFVTYGLVPIAAFFGALIAVLVVYRLAHVGSLTPITTLLLAGFAVGSMLGALMSAMMLLSRGTLERVVLWTLGGVSASGWGMLLAVTPLILLGTVIAFALANDLNVFLLGEEQAATMGVDVERKKFILLCTGALLTGAAVALSGLVGFVGLIVPHFVRILVGPNHRLLLPASFLSGAIFLTIADLIARTLLAPQEIPLGVVTALVGAPFFILLLRRAKKEYTFLILQPIHPLDTQAMAEAQARQNRLTKPTGALGRLETLSIQLAGITRTPRPRFHDPVIFTLAADHGITQQGVSAYPPAVTQQMVLNFVRGGAAINVLARHVGARVVVADLGVNADFPPTPGIVDAKIAHGTHDLSQEPAMTRAQAEQAVRTGIELVKHEIARGADLVGTGDMGIGNTTSSSAIVAAITGRSAAEVTGRGTGVDDTALAHKKRVIASALARHKPNAQDSLDVLAKVGGFEIGGLAGVMLGAAAENVPVVLDGFIAGAAALLAYGLDPLVLDYLVPAHRSVEVGHRAVLEYLKLNPLLDLDLRLGEGTGAALGISLCLAAAKILDEMATFEDAGVSDKDG